MYCLTPHISPTSKKEFALGVVKDTIFGVRASL